MSALSLANIFIVAGHLYPKKENHHFHLNKEGMQGKLLPRFFFNYLLSLGVLTTILLPFFMAENLLPPSSTTDTPLPGRYFLAGKFDELIEIVDPSIS